MFKKLISGLLIFCLSFTLCGCDFFMADTAELLSPPALSDNFKHISEAIKESAQSDYSMEYPKFGEYRSAVVQKDIDRDGVIEVGENYVFYTYNHYNDFQEYLNYEGGWGEMFGNITGGGTLSSKYE